MLKTLGLVRRQVLSVVEWQALSLAGVALLVGVPLGLLAGRWAWVLFAGAAGVAPAASIPVPLVLAHHPGHRGAGRADRGLARPGLPPGSGPPPCCGRNDGGHDEGAP